MDSSFITSSNASVLNSNQFGQIHDKDSIQPHSVYARALFETLQTKYDNMINHYNANKDTIIRKQNFFKV